LKDFDLDRFGVVSAPTTRTDSAFAAQLCERAGLVVRVVDGFCVNTGKAIDGVSVEVDESTKSSPARRSPIGIAATRSPS